MLSRDLKKYIGRRLREIRKSLGESQEQFADRLGCTQEQVSKMEQGERHLTATAVYELAVTLQIPVSSFFPPQAESDVVDDEHSLLEAWRMRDYPEVLRLLTEHLQADAMITKRRKK